MAAKGHRVLVTNPDGEKIVLRGIAKYYVIVPVGEELFEVHYGGKYLGESTSLSGAEKFIQRGGASAPVLIQNPNGGYEMYKHKYKAPAKSNPKKKSKKKKSTKKRATKKRSTSKKKSTKKKATKKKSTKKKSTKKRKGDQEARHGQEEGHEEAHQEEGDQEARHGQEEGHEEAHQEEGDQEARNQEAQHRQEEGHEEAHDQEARNSEEAQHRQEAHHFEEAQLEQEEGDEEGGAEEEGFRGFGSPKPHRQEDRKATDLVESPHQKLAHRGPESLDSLR
jgi:hypothetical protein